MSKWSRRSSSNTSWPLALRSYFQRNEKASIPSPTQRLPAELYHHIFSFLPLGTKLYPLLFVDSGFHAEAEHMLYSNLSLKGDQIGKKYRERKGPRYTHVHRRVKLFKVLACTSRLSHGVQVLSIPPFIMFGDWRKWNDQHLQESYWSLLNLALREMPNLMEFTLGRYWTESYEMVLAGQLLDAIFDGCPFRLRKLGLAGHTCGDIQTLENGDFAAQLEELAIREDPNGRFNVDNALPQLNILEIHNWSDRCSRLLPQILALPRRVKALWVIGAKESLNNNDATKGSLQSYPELQSLRFYIGGEGEERPCWHPVVQRLVATFPSLCFLRIDYYFLVGCHHILGLAGEVATTLRALKNLRKIALCGARGALYGGEWGYLGFETVNQSRSIAQQLFADIPQLETALVGFEEWRRGQIQAGEHTYRDDTAKWEAEWKDRKWWTRD